MRQTDCTFSTAVKLAKGPKSVSTQTYSAGEGDLRLHWLPKMLAQMCPFLSGVHDGISGLSMARRGGETDE